MATTIKKFATAVEIDQNTLAGTVITATNSGQSRVFTELTISNTSTTLALTVSVFVVDTADLPIDVTLFNAAKVIQPGKVWNVLADLGGLTMSPSQSLVSFPLIDSIGRCSAGGYEQT